MVITLIGSFLSNSQPTLKITWIFDINRGQFISIIGSVIFLIATIFYNSYSTKLEKEKDLKHTKELQEVRTENKKHKSELEIMNRFHAEVDNPIKSIYFILDLGSTLLKDNFRDFSCIIRFDLLDISIQFKTVRFDNQLSENTEYIEAKFVKGKNLADSPFITVSTSSFKNISEFYLDLKLINNLLPKNFTIRDLSDQTFYFYLSEEQTKLVKGIKLNVNNWDIFNKSGNAIHWRELKQDWIPDRKDLRVFYQEYQNRYYDYNTIQFFKEGFNYYEIVTYNTDTRSRIPKKNLVQMLDYVNDSESSLIIDIDNKWRIQNNALIDYLPLVVKNGLSLRIYRDTDNILKVSLSYKYAKNIILRCKYPENFIDSNENHRLIITWSSEKAVFYIDGKEVDEFIIN